MRVHGPQMNPYAAIDTLRSAQKTAARREAELVRKELSESASELASEAELDNTFVVERETRQHSQRQPRRRNRPTEKNMLQDSANNSTDSGAPSQLASEIHLSDWA